MVINLIIFSILLLFLIGAIAGIVEALIKTWNSNEVSLGMVRLKRYAISALVAIVVFFASIVSFQFDYDGQEVILPITVFSLLIFFILTIIMFLWLMGDTLGYKKRFRRVYLLSVVSLVVLMFFWAWLGYVPSTYGPAVIVE